MWNKEAEIVLKKAGEKKKKGAGPVAWINHPGQILAHWAPLNTRAYCSHSCRLTSGPHAAVRSSPNRLSVQTTRPVYTYKNKRLCSQLWIKLRFLYPTTVGISRVAICPPPPRHNSSIVPRVPPGPKPRRFHSSLGGRGWGGARFPYRHTPHQQQSSERTFVFNKHTGFFSDILYVF